MQNIILEPVTVGVQTDVHAQQGNIKLNISNIRLNISPDIVELFMTLHTSVLSPLLQPSADKPAAKCASFVKVKFVAFSKADHAVVYKQDHPTCKRACPLPLGGRELVAMLWRPSDRATQPCSLYPPQEKVSSISSPTKSCSFCQSDSLSRAVPPFA